MSCLLLESNHLPVRIRSVFVIPYIHGKAAHAFINLLVADRGGAGGRRDGLPAKAPV